MNYSYVVLIISASSLWFLGSKSQSCLL